MGGIPLPVKLMGVLPLMLTGEDFPLSLVATALMAAF